VNTPPLTATALGDARKRLGIVGEWIDDFAGDPQARGTSLVYVFDTDVLTMYSRPELGASYCALLRDEADARVEHRGEETGSPGAFAEAEVLLADILGNHVVWGRDEPALSSPAHADELAEVMTAVVVSALKQLPDLRDALTRGFKELAADYPQHQDARTQGSWLQSRLDAMLRALRDGQGDVLRALRLQAAFDSERIFSIETYKSPMEPHYLPSSIDEDTGDFREEVVAVGRQIEKLLVAGASFSEFRLSRIRADSLALAQLCWVNKQLEGDRRAVRLRFVTGSPHLHRLRAPSSEWAGRLSEPLRSLLDMLQPELRALIRHPLGFLDDEGMLKLLGLDGSALSQGGRLCLFLRDRLPGPAPDDDARGAHELASAARELTALLAAAHTRQLIGADRTWLAAMAQETLSSQHDSWEQVIGSHVEKLMPRFLASLASLAALQRQGRRADGVSRNLPPLSLPAFDACADFCRRLYADLAVNPDAADDAKARLAQVIERDSTLYTPLLAIALWRAAESNWRRARVMSRAAVELVERFVQARQDARNEGKAPAGPETERIFGEEAHYLHAVTLRLTAGLDQPAERAMADLDEALRQIGRAGDQVINRCAALGDPYPGPDPRHAAERMSIGLTRALWRRLGSTADAAAHDERALFDGGLELLQTLVGASPANPAQDRYLFDYVLQQVCVVMAQAVLLDRYGVFGPEVFPIRAATWSEAPDCEPKLKTLWDSFDGQCRRLVEHRPGPDEPPLPSVTALVRAVWRVLDLELQINTRAANMRQYRSELDRSLLPRHQVAGIDALRFNFLRKIAIRHLGAA